MGMISNLPAANLGNWGKVEKVAILLLGPDSAIYRVFLDTVGIPFQKFARVMATFLIICQMNQNLSKLWEMTTLIPNGTCRPLSSIAYSIRCTAMAYSCLLCPNFGSYCKKHLTKQW